MYLSFFVLDLFFLYDVSTLSCSPLAPLPPCTLPPSLPLFLLPPIPTATHQGASPAAPQQQAKSSTPPTATTPVASTPTQQQKAAGGMVPPPPSSEWGGHRGVLYIHQLINVNSGLQYENTSCFQTPPSYMWSI